MGAIYHAYYDNIKSFHQVFTENRLFSLLAIISNYRLWNGQELGVGGMMDYPGKLLAPLFLDVVLGPKCSSKRIFEKKSFLAVCTPKK